MSDDFRETVWCRVISLSVSSLTGRQEKARNENKAQTDNQTLMYHFLNNMQWMENSMLGGSGLWINNDKTNPKLNKNSTYTCPRFIR